MKRRAMKSAGPRSEQRADRLPACLETFFWDVDASRLSLRSSSHFIIARLMEHGDERAIRFMLHFYSIEEMRAVLRSSRSLSRRSREFWRIVLDIEAETCTPVRYPTPYGSCYPD